MKRTEKGKANSRQKSKANSRQKSTANGRQDKSRANSRQSKLRPRQGEVRGETQYRGKLQPASPGAPENRCRCPAGATRAEAWRSDHDHPRDRLRRGNRGLQVNRPDSSGAVSQKVQKTVKIPQVRDCEHSAAFSQLEADVR